MDNPAPPLTLAVAQPACVPHDVATNAAAHAVAIRSANARVVVFPELSLTGYALDAAALAADDERLAVIVHACADTDAIAFAGAPVRSEDGEHIAILRFDAVGVSVAYRKMHPDAEESQRFLPGAAPVVLTVGGWRLGLAVCRDAMNPTHSVETGQLGMDVYVAGLLTRPERLPVQDRRMAEIARTQGVWVAAASYAGPTAPYPRTAGGSGVWSPDGSAVRTGAEPGAVVTATVRAPDPPSAPAPRHGGWRAFLLRLWRSLWG
ncbi:carbon-nitrogen hydrolase family protein [Spiractinospora alimapuensis]|uniref:carbon-nitrogen hydrolase family protein n=1 Tax=Spiractinospora alimapuensis TaxID=2820884 RepID=UPI001F2C9EE9|nr:carbon-nitrogen hydrolase family protein [Spiractinospora alimapuensis]QVQ51788.1 carbon-nitrogen hydrolase family protein [Spiractinospora alimapuensis]